MYIHQTKTLCILVPQPFWHLICIHLCSCADYELFLVHLLMIPFAMNLVSNISTKAPKKAPYLIPD